MSKAEQYVAKLEAVRQSAYVQGRKDVLADVSEMVLSEAKTLTDEGNIDGAEAVLRVVRFLLSYQRK